MSRPTHVEVEEVVRRTRELAAGGSGNKLGGPGSPKVGLVRMTTMPTSRTEIRSGPEGHRGARAKNRHGGDGAATGDIAA